MSNRPTVAPNWAAALARKAAPTPGPIHSGSSAGAMGSAWSQLRMPGSQYDYQAQAGPLWLNSVVAVALGWIQKNYPEPILGVRRKASADTWKWDDAHPLLKVVDRPNDDHAFGELMTAVRLSLTVDGNGYLLKGRDAGGKLAAFYYATHDQVEPLPDPEGESLIWKYRLWVDGKPRDLMPSQVVHFRTGIDPTNPRKGLSPLKAQLREVCSDNEAATYTAATLRNLGVVGMLLSMKDGSSIDPDDADALTREVVRKTTGENLGRPITTTHPMEVQEFGRSPEEMVLDKIRVIPEARILGAIGINAQVLGLTSGEGSKTFANAAEAREAAYEDYLLPAWKSDAAQLQRAISSDYPDRKADYPDLADRRRTQVAFDTSEIAALADDRAKTSTMVVGEYAAGLRTLNEAREPLGLDPRPDGDDLKAPPPPPVLPGADGKPAKPGDDDQAEGDDEDDPPDDEPPPKPKGKGKPEGKDRRLSTKAGGVIPGDQVGPDEDNTHGLPDGAPLRNRLRSYFAKQAKEVLGDLPEIGAPLPDAFQPLADYDDPMASAMTPILSAYWHEAGAEIRERIGLDPDEWRVVDPNVREAIESAALSFCEETNATTTKHLNDALGELKQSLIDGIVAEGESIAQLAKRVQAVFETASDERAEMIARTEASRAVNGASLMSARTSGVVQAKKWLLSSNACPRCHSLAEQSAIPLGDRFGTFGTHPDYAEVQYPPAHPRCRCSLVYVLSPSYLDSLPDDAKIPGEVAAFGDQKEAA